MNIRDIAQLANVTPGTVSKVLNNYPDISEQTRQLVMKIIDENEYKPSNYNRLVKSEPVPSIGMIVEGVYNGVYSTIEDMLSIRLHNGSYTVLSYHDNYHAQEKTEKFQELITYIDVNKLNGVIYMGGNFRDVPDALFKKISCPIIFINSVLPPNMAETTYSSVQVSNFDTAYQQMTYLIKKKHKNICTLISSFSDASAYGIRMKAYKIALSDYQLEHNFENIIEGDYDNKRSYAEVTNLLKKNPSITAICCAADIMCVSVLRAITDLGKIPGKDIEIISFDGIEEMNYLAPSITTFVQPVKDLVICIYDLLIGLIKKERTPQHITFQPTLIINESCK